MTGIAMLLIIQLGFTLFLRTTDLLEKSSEVVKTADVPFYPLRSFDIPVASVSQEDLETHSSIPDREVSIMRPAYRLENAVYTRNRSAHRNAAYSAAKKRPQPISVDRFRDTIIEIPAVASRTRRALQIDDLASVRFEKEDSNKKPDRRSFLATASPLVKKPYGWMKAIGSKLF